MADTRTIALFGKGGVGKTSISALMVHELARRKAGRILAIDADPAVGLATALGVGVDKTIDDIRKGLIDRLKDGGGDKSETINLLDYEVFDALVEHDGFSFLAIGRPEDEGCYCRVNYLLKDILHELADNFDVVVIDAEAGIEQINRRVMKTVENLVLISDTSAKGVHVAETIAHVAGDNDAVDYERLGLVLNRVRTSEEVDKIASRTDLPLFGWLGEDDQIREYDFEGRALTELPEDAPTKQLVAGILDALEF